MSDMIILWLMTVLGTSAFWLIVGLLVLDRNYKNWSRWSGDALDAMHKQRALIDEQHAFNVKLVGNMEEVRQIGQEEGKLMERQRCLDVVGSYAGGSGYDTIDGICDLIRAEGLK